MTSFDVVILIPGQMNVHALVTRLGLVNLEPFQLFTFLAPGVASAHTHCNIMAGGRKRQAILPKGLKSADHDADRREVSDRIIS